MFTAVVGDNKSTPFLVWLELLIYFFKPQFPCIIFIYRIISSLLPVNQLKYLLQILDFLQLLEKCLTPNADERISIASAMKTSWIASAQNNIVNSYSKLNIRHHGKVF